MVEAGNNQGDTVEHAGRVITWGAADTVGGVQGIIRKGLKGMVK